MPCRNDGWQRTTSKPLHTAELDVTSRLTGVLASTGRQEAARTMEHELGVSIDDGQVGSALAGPT
jgi:hypothetical protein